MEGGITFDSLLQNQRLNFSSDEYNSPWVSNSSHGDKTYTKEYNSDEDYETGYRQPPEKKRRLSVEQVECLEKSFKEENKLEPERKIELAKQLDLQPRQVAIWFQNRRARCKTKQLEKDYEILNTNYHHLKLEFDSLQKQNDQLKQEVQMLKEKLQQKELREKDRFPTIELKSDMQETNPVQAWSDEPKMVICKQEYANSVSSKSDIIDSYSPEGNRSSFLEPCDSSNVFENQSDFSQDEEDNLTILRCPKIEYESYIDPNEGSLGYPINDQSFWLWP